LPIYHQASKYNLTHKYEFFYINCNTKETPCNKFSLKKFPSIKTYIDSIELDNEPTFNLESVLEFIDKLESHSSVIKIGKTTNVSLNDFYENYGEVSFILRYNESESSQSKESSEVNNYFYKCIKHISEEKYKSEFYFGFHNIFGDNNFSTNTNLNSKTNTSIPNNINNNKDNFPQILVINKYNLLLISIYLYYLGFWQNFSCNQLLRHKTCFT